MKKNSKIRNKNAEGADVPRCGLCGKTQNLTQTECCGQWICDDEDQYVAFSYAGNSCHRNHSRYTLCGFHFNESHKGDWKTCPKCREEFSGDLEMYAHYGTNEYNFEVLENPPAFKPTCCIRCGNRIVKSEGGYMQNSEGCICFNCEASPLEKFKPKKKVRHKKRSADTDYRPPLDQLLKLKDLTKERKWPDYAAMGFTQEHVFELIRMATDESFFDKPVPETFATVHAWRVLGLLKAQEAVKPLTEILCWVKDYNDDWILEEMPAVFCAIGPDCLPELERYLCNTSHDEFARVAVNTALEKIHAAYPEVRGECVRIGRRALKTYKDNGPGLNAFLISNLADWRDMESLTLIEQAFIEDCVECTVNGDWEDIQIQMGLLKKRLTPKRSLLHGLMTRNKDLDPHRPRWQIAETSEVEDEPEQETVYQARKDDLRKRRKKAKKNH